jgi:hypothetical protein
LKDLLRAAELEPSNKQLRVDSAQTRELLRNAVSRAPLVSLQEWNEIVNEEEEEEEKEERDLKEKDSTMMMKLGPDLPPPSLVGNKKKEKRISEENEENEEEQTRELKGKGKEHQQIRETQSQVSPENITNDFHKIVIEEEEEEDENPIDEKRNRIKINHIIEEEEEEDKEKDEKEEENRQENHQTGSLPSTTLKIEFVDDQNEEEDDENENENDQKKLVDNNNHDNNKKKKESSVVAADSRKKSKTTTKSDRKNKKTKSSSTGSGFPRSCYELDRILSSSSSSALAVAQLLFADSRRKDLLSLFKNCFEPISLFLFLSFAGNHLLHLNDNKNNSSQEENEEEKQRLLVLFEQITELSNFSLLFSLLSEQEKQTIRQLMSQAMKSLTGSQEEEEEDQQKTGKRWEAVLRRFD